MLMFEEPVLSVPIISDRFQELPDVIRLFILEPIESEHGTEGKGTKRGRRTTAWQLAFHVRHDYLKVPPGKLLSVDLDGESIHF